MKRRDPIPVLSVKNLGVSFHTSEGVRHVVDGVSLNIGRGEAVAVVGESGSGKSVTMLASMGLLPPSANVTSDHIVLNGEPIGAASAERMATLLGTEISMVFQNPMTSLNPTMRIGQQVSETVAVHDPDVSQSELEALSVRLLGEVQVPNPELRARQYPHEFSGGMRQRAVIAMALAGEPGIIVADEPTTALDVTVQAQIVELIRDLRKRHGVASVVITHDLGLVAELAERVIVMYAGHVVEETPVVDLFDNPAHPYTQALLRSRPSSNQDRHRLETISGLPPMAADSVEGCPFHPRCEHAQDLCKIEKPALTRLSENRAVACHFHLNAPGTQAAVVEQRDERQVSRDEPGRTVLKIEGVTKSFGQIHATNGIDLQLREGETLGIAGESGCGKSTLARLAMGLLLPTKGRVEVNGREISKMRGRELRAARREIQMVFQDPTSSLDRRMTIRYIIAEPMRIAGFDKKRIEAKVRELMASVGLPEHYMKRRPSELSGGQRQRVGIARALALDPSVILFDEPTSALDVSVQAQIVNLLDDLRAERQAGYIFISHDLGVLRHVSDRIAIMYLGRIVETGTRSEIFSSPRHPYTNALLSSIPAWHPRDKVTERFVVDGVPPDPVNIPSGCSFRLRCPLAESRCTEQLPALEVVSGDGHQVACHFRDDLVRLRKLSRAAS